MHTGRTGRDPRVDIFTSVLVSLKAKFFFRFFHVSYDSEQLSILPGKKIPKFFQVPVGPDRLAVLSFMNRFSRLITLATLRDLSPRTVLFARL